jgi:hypothetical protein
MLAIEHRRACGTHSIVITAKLFDAKTIMGSDAITICPFANRLGNLLAFGLISCAPESLQPQLGLRYAITRTELYAKLNCDRLTHAPSTNFSRNPIHVVRAAYKLRQSPAGSKSRQVSSLA